jgi:ketosteroid isomerase-like protein
MSHPADLAIRLARAAFNRALAAGDLAAIGPLLAPNAVLVTGTDSAVLAGKKAQLQAWKREFSAPARMVYTRTPHSIEASPIAPIAMEHGTWQGAVDGHVQASGSYSAKWRNIAPTAATPQWVIEGEIYLTLT